MQSSTNERDRIDMDIFGKLAGIADQHDKIISAGKDPFGVRIEKILSATEAIIDGRKVLLAGTNNYLGLTFHPECIDAAADAVRRCGTGTTGSRIANGTYANHTELEARLAKFLGRKSVMVFSTGYLANLGTIAGLVGADDYVLIDADCHASIYDGCRLCGATIIRFRHNNPANLDRRLNALDPEANRLIIVEGLYSMLGDIAPLAEFAEVKRKHNAYLLADEAHSVGVYGPHGRGVAEQVGVSADVDFVVGTFSKSLGSIGGFCASDHPSFPYLKFASRPYMFTASPAPSSIASVLAAVDLIERDPGLMAALWRNARALHEGLAALGLTLGADPSPIIAVRMPSLEAAVGCWNLLMEAGVYVNLAIPPGTPNSMSLLRCSVSAALTLDQIERIRLAFEPVAQEIGATATESAVPVPLSAAGD